MSTGCLVAIILGTILGIIVIVGITLYFKKQINKCKSDHPSSSQSSAASNTSHSQPRERNGNARPTSTTPLLPFPNNSEQPSEEIPAHADGSVERQGHQTTERSRHMAYTDGDQQPTGASSIGRVEASMGPLSAAVLGAKDREIAVLSSALEKVKQALIQAEKTRDQLTDYNERILSEKKEKEDEIADHKKTITELGQLIENERLEHSQESEHQKEKIKLLEEKLKEAQSMKEELERKSEELRLNREAFEREKADHAEKVKALKQDVDELSSKLEAARKTKAAKDKETRDPSQHLPSSMSPHGGSPQGRAAALLANISADLSRGPGPLPGDGLSSQTNSDEESDESHASNI